MARCSVCITTYNGEKFIRKQLMSILSQLSADDEIIVSDDSSTDNTLAVVQMIQDSRIRVYPGNVFKSPIFNFESCISKANGDIIFLSDQDDLWRSNKVTSVTAIFRDKPEVTLVASDARIINDKDDVIADSFFSERFIFTPGVFNNIVRNHFIGCTLAFRKTMLEVLLPFPRKLPMHDSWIGIINQIFGAVHFIDSPLIDYRKHAGNYCSGSGTGLARKVAWRWNLARAVAGRMAKCRGWKCGGAA